MKADRTLVTVTIEKEPFGYKTRQEYVYDTAHIPDVARALAILLTVAFEQTMSEYDVCKGMR